MEPIILAYTIYLPVALGLTIYVSKRLFTNSKVFMLDIFHGRQEIAFSTNALFETGFYLLNVGFALCILPIYDGQEMSGQRVFEVLSLKIGGFSIYLGVMLFANLLLFFRGRRVANEHKTAGTGSATAAPKQANP